GRHDPDLRAAAGDAGLGARLRAAARAGAPDRAQPRQLLLGAGEPVPEDRTGTRLPGRRRGGVRLVRHTPSVEPGPLHAVGRAPGPPHPVGGPQVRLTPWAGTRTGSPGWRTPPGRRSPPRSAAGRGA